MSDKRLCLRGAVIDRVAYASTQSLDTLVTELDLGTGDQQDLRDLAIALQARSSQHKMTVERILAVLRCDNEPHYEDLAVAGTRKREHSKQSALENIHDSFDMMRNWQHTLLERARHLYQTTYNEGSEFSVFGQATYDARGRRLALCASGALVGLCSADILFSL